MPTLSAAPEISPGGRTERQQTQDAAMSPEQEASPPPAAPGASPPPQAPTRLPSPVMSNTMDNSDVEQFAGKIVYNPDGSAYIIEDSESESETSNTHNPVPDIVPPLQAVYVSRLLRQASRATDLPAVHSYRVISLRDARPPRPASVPVKPILMCFVCKLSFGFARSFANHAQSEHGVTLKELEREVLAADSSAILQCVGADKRPVVSLLEPLGPALDNQGSHFMVPVSRHEGNHSPITETPPCSSSRTTPGKSPSPPFAPPPAFMTGTTIGVCPEHLQGRPSGVECARCEMILASGRLGPAGLANVHSRNSCKTLKCPKCNWHYKYQETLEIHMKEKHPEAETSCIYCIAGQPHPRLARGETYTCGYKPYRCEVCNYSTTTKGNLSIHMQSDKHLNNMQELQNGGAPNTEARQASPKAAPLHHSPVSSGHKPKPSFRCDVCNYETNVARNLRIHMTSEKHTHNMLVLQQNVKHMQTLSALHHQPHAAQQHMESLYGMYPGLGDKPEAALADMAYNQALLIQMMTGGQLPGHAGPADMAAPHADMGLNPETMEPPPEPAEPDPERVFHCCVCNAFTTDSLEELGRHLAQDRTRLREQEILAVVAGHYVCKLCTYKTNLKANFQLHCKTDKHLQRLHHVNHVKEGGPRNEWKLKYASAPGGVQIRCNACDYYTNSAHKLQLHAAAGRHDAGVALLKHLCERCATLRPDQPRVYHCSLCGFSATNRLPLLQHVKSMKHLHMEQLHQLQRRAEGKDTSPEIGEVFHVVPGPVDQHIPERRDSINSEISQGDNTRDPNVKSELREDNDESFSENAAQQCCPFCDYTSDSEMRIQAHVLAQHGANAAAASQIFRCPLCQDMFKDRTSLERHVMQIHSVNSEGLQRLLLLVDQSHWLNQASRTPTPNNSSNQLPNSTVSPNSVSSKDSNRLEKSDSSLLEADRELMSPTSDDNAELEAERCNTCSKTFKNIDELCYHQTETGHLEVKQTPSGPGYMCWKKGCNQFFPTANTLQMHFKDSHAKNSITNMSVSEKHVYKYRCNQCSLAFKTLEKLQLHSQYHMIRDATKCVLCGRSFRSLVALHKHVESAHSELTDEELNAYKQSLMNNPLLLAGLQGQVLDSSTNDILKKESLRTDDVDITDCDDSKEINTSHDDSNQNDGENSDDSIIYKDQQFLEDYLNSQAIAEDSYNDPNRKYKCHRCKVAFTRQSYLTAHNKTLLHKKGEKLSYPMEKYLDPNRPYKCDVCKESFTQKNILLVHYNSVSHLHKLKRAMQEQQNNNNNPPMSPVMGGTQPQNMTLTPKSTSSEEDDKKRYRCNICKVAYTQGSTLDIHMRSVLHQTRASKLQDLAMAGQIDLSKPLIEQPEAMQSPKQSSPLPGGGDKASPTPVSPGAGSQGMMGCPKCGALFSSQDQLNTHQQLYCMFSAPMAIFQSVQEPGQAKSPPPPNGEQDSTASASKLPMAKKNTSHMYKHLLESFGFDLVMQYNESHQRRHRMREGTDEEKTDGTTPPLPATALEDPAKAEEDTDLPEFKMEYEKKNVVVTAATSSTLNSTPRVTTPNAPTSTSPAATPDKDDESKEALHAKLELHTPPEAMSTAPSTPTSSTTPVSTPEGALPANLQAMLAQSMAQNPMALAQLTEMQAALNVMQLQQMNFNPMMQMMGMGLPLGLNALAAMNLQPPLVPLMMPPPNFDHMNQFGPQDQMMNKQQALMQQQAAASAAANQKRARTRITDDQLKILRAHFDINNSPSEDQIHEMANQSGLPPKVIKHWFRNTLFKERQRNKDSPYNFNNPPSTTLNLEEYEKTGETKVLPLNSSGSSTEENPKLMKSPTPPIQTEIKTELKEEPADDQAKYDEKMHDALDDKSNIFHLPPQSPATSVASSENMSGTHVSGPSTPNSLTLTSIIASQLGESLTTSTPTLNLGAVATSHHGLTSPMLPPPKLNQQNYPNPGSLQSMLPITPTRCLSPSREYSNPGSHGSCGSSGKRANRTRFTDYQIKVLQEFFENNAYPKDDDLEYLSKLLSLSPRVIVVWFQNARQKARKVYENQPATEPSPAAGPTTEEAGANRFQRTPGLNYQCKKCLLVFQRYYELIRHQKTHCFKEEDAKRSAQAQAAAAQIAAVLSSEDSNSSTTVEQSHQQNMQQHQQQQNQQVQNCSLSPIQPNQPTTPTPSQQGSNYPPSPSESDTKEGTFQCDKCNLVFPRFDLWREHQLVHLMNPNLFPTYSPDSPFGILQQHAQLQQQLNAANLGGDLTKNNATTSAQHPLINMLNNVSGQKRKMEEFEVESDASDQPKDKRLRTTILPEQLDYLYQKYQIESNPSRKMLENIAREVGLKKRVVQVWFQNTRARERKGQFRAHAQVINKRCPFCPALFKVKSALESHLTTKHADQCARGEVNIDALPDEELSLESAPSICSGSDSKFQSNSNNMMPPIFSSLPPDMENSIKKYYEDSMKRYISELQAHSSQSSNGDKSEIKIKEEGEIPLDLSKPVDLSRPMKVSMDGSFCDAGPLTDLSERSLCDERSDTMSETTEYYDDESNPTSPASSTQSQKMHNSSSSGANKRYRTQMSSVQVKIMKLMFGDYKTPTMAECEMLGREIGLPKRVVQVWFQNARAKEKKGKLALQKALGGNESSSDQPQTLPDDCKFCNFKYSHKYSVQDHIFTRSHIGNVRVFLENSSSKEPENSEFTVPPLPGASGVINADSTTNPQQPNLNNNSQLQLLQMASMQMAAAAKGEQDGDQESIFQQIYSLGNNANHGFQNQFMHHAMFSANDFPGAQLGKLLSNVESS